MKKPAFLSVVAYAAEVMTMPVGTRFELHGQKVGRVTYTARTCKLLMNAMYPGRWTIQRRCTRAASISGSTALAGTSSGTTPSG